ncbi:MAG TPA: FAD-dependent oxidoreductase [Holophagaceae bacterium]|nr:FAD-dependent oxidoreductase [Holophagaceae bacterium]
MKTLVLGGGISGLIAAWHLQRRGETVEVWEADAEPGGWVQTLPWEGGHIEKGPQGVLVSPGSAVERLFVEIGLETRSPGHGARWVGKGGSLIPVPAKPPGILTSRLMPLSARLRLLLEPFMPVRAAEPEEGLSAFVARRLGRGAAEHLLPAMVAGILAAPAEALSVDALPKLRQWEAKGSLFHGLRAEPRSELRVPVGGMGMLPKTLAKSVPVHCGLRADRLERNGAGWRVSGGGDAREVDRVLLACPAFEAARLLGPLAPQSAGALAGMPYTSVRLFHSRHAPLALLKDGFGFLVHPPEGRGFLGTLVPSWIDPDSAPAGLMQLRSFVGGAFMTDPSLESWEGVSTTLKAWVPALGEASALRELLADRAIPRPELGHRARLAQALGGLPEGLDWISNARFGPGVRDVIEGLAIWAGSVSRA